jgi:hypothetical protein
MNYEQPLFTTNKINFVAPDHAVSRVLIPQIAVGDDEVQVTSIFWTYSLFS